MINTNYQINQPNFKGSLKIIGLIPPKEEEELQKLVAKLPKEDQYIAHIASDFNEGPSGRYGGHMGPGENTNKVDVSSCRNGKLNLEFLSRTFPSIGNKHAENSPFVMLKEYFTNLLIKS